jgi:hypothetical protein
VISIERKRFGELSEGLPESTKSVACVERNVQEHFDKLSASLGRPASSCHKTGRLNETPGREAKKQAEVRLVGKRKTRIKVRVL